MSSFYKRENDPQPGDIGTDPNYGNVSLIGPISLFGSAIEDYGYWLAEDEDNRYVIVSIDCLKNIGYYGD